MCYIYLLIFSSYVIDSEGQRQFESVATCVQNAFRDDKSCGVKVGDGKYDWCGGSYNISRLQFANANPWFVPIIIVYMRIEEVRSLPLQLELFGKK